MPIVPNFTRYGTPAATKVRTSLIWLSPGMPKRVKEHEPNSAQLRPLRHLGDQDVALRGSVCGYADDQAGGGDDAIICPQHRRPEPSDARHKMAFRVQVKARQGVFPMGAGVAY